VLYLDTSAFLKLYIREADSFRVQQWVSSQNDPLPVTDLLEMEFTNALWLNVHWKNLSHEEVKSLLDHFRERKRRNLYFQPEISRSDLLNEFRRLAPYSARIGCRTMDVVHVANAMVLKVDQFVSFDTRQRALAEMTGLRLSEL
jgi:predicted nucleic acid-binding protein